MTDTQTHEVLIGIDKTVAFNPEVARAFGGIHEALLFQQLYFWRNLGIREDGFIYKTKEDLEAETCLNRYQQDRARRALEALEVLETRLLKANGSPTIHYRVNVSKANEILTAARLTNGKAETSEWKSRIQLMEKLKPTNGKAETSDSITENTTKKTTENTTKKRQGPSNSGEFANEVQDKSQAVSSVAAPSSKSEREPTPIFQLVDYVRSVQAHAEYTNPKMHFRYAKLVLENYSLEEAKQAVDLMLKDDWWKQKGITTKNLADHVHRFIGEVRANPEVTDHDALVSTARFLLQIPDSDANEIGKEFNLHWMALQRVGRDIVEWMKAHRRAKSDVRVWLRAEIAPQADQLRKTYGQYVFVPPMPPEMAELYRTPLTTLGKGEGNP